MPARSYTSGPADADQVSTEGLTFTLDDVTFTCHGMFDAMDMQDLAAELMDATDDWADPKALGAVGQLLRTILGDATYTAFRRHRREHRTPHLVVAQIIADLIEDISDLPTNRPSALPAGRPTTASSSAGGSPSPASRRQPQDRRPKAAHRRPARQRPARSPAGRAQDPEGIIPPEWAGSGDVITAPAPPPPGDDPAGQMNRVINLGDASRTRVEPLHAAG